MEEDTGSGRSLTTPVPAYPPSDSSDSLLNSLNVSSTQYTFPSFSAHCLSTPTFYSSTISTFAATSTTYILSGCTSSPGDLLSKSHPNSTLAVENSLLQPVDATNTVCKSVTTTKVMNQDVALGSNSSKKGNNVATASTSTNNNSNNCSTNCFTEISNPVATDLNFVRSKNNDVNSNSVSVSMTMEKNVVNNSNAEIDNLVTPSTSMDQNFINSVM